MVYSKSHPSLELGNINVSLILLHLNVPGELSSAGLPGSHPTTMARLAYIVVVFRITPRPPQLLDNSRIRLLAMIILAFLVVLVLGPENNISISV